MKILHTIIFVAAITLTTFIGYCYGRRDASLEESVANLQINTLAASGIRNGETSAALRVMETAISIQADGFERYNAPFGAIRVFLNRQKAPNPDYRTQAFRNANQYIATFSPGDVTPAAASSIRTLAQ